MIAARVFELVGREERTEPRAQSDTLARKEPLATLFVQWIKEQR